MCVARRICCFSPPALYRCVCCRSSCLAMLSVTHLTRSYDENGGAMTSLDQQGLERPDAPGSDPRAPLLEVDDLHVEFRTRDGVLNAVNGVSFNLQEGETLSVLGESGSGKSVTAQAVMGIIDTPPGYITHGHVR